MKRLKHGITLAALVAISALGLYACGGESPTATVVAPAAGTAQATSPSTTAAPTATTAMSAPTTATGSTEPTATTAGTSGSSISGSSDAITLLKNAAAAMNGVKSYHVVVKIDAAGASTSGEGDVVMPDRRRITTNAGTGGTSEIIAIGTTLYTRLAGTDTYLETDSGVDLFSPVLATTSAFAGLAQNATNATVVGDEPVDGVAATHVKFSYNLANAVGQSSATPGTSLGESNADVWIEKTTGYIHKFMTSSTLAGTQSNTSVTFSKFNEDVIPPIDKPANVQQLPSIPTIALP